MKKYKIIYSKGGSLPISDSSNQYKNFVVKINHINFQLTNVLKTKTVKELVKEIEEKIKNEYESFLTENNLTPNIQKILHNSKYIILNSQNEIKYIFNSEWNNLSVYLEPKKSQSDIFLDSIFNNDNSMVIDILDKLLLYEQKELIINSRSHLDNNKTAIHYIARFGNIELLNYFKTILNEGEFKQLIGVTDNERRTPLILGLRSFGETKSSNFKQLINLLIDNMSEEDLKIVTIQNYDALMASIHYKVDDDIIQKIYDSIPLINQKYNLEDIKQDMETRKLYY